MAMVNINRENTDMFYRYKMPCLIAKARKGEGEREGGRGWEGGREREGGGRERESGEGGKGGEVKGEGGNGGCYCSVVGSLTVNSCTNNWSCILTIFRQ